MIFSCSSNLGQARGGDGLPVPLFLLVGNMKTDALMNFGELLPQNLGGHAENQVAADARQDPPQHQKVADVVEIRVVRDVVAEEHADGSVDPAGALIAGRNQAL